MTTYEEQLEEENMEFTLISSLIAGGMAGTFVDIALFPLDTLKTRLQSKQGFIKSGGFSGLYKGILPVILGSAPAASLFFMTYENFKSVTECRVPEKYYSLLHMGAASLAEMVACLIRVPTEVLKQRKQVSVLNKKDITLRVLYRGYWSTIARDMPFSLIQFPLWEYFKKHWSLNINRDILPTESAICGAFAGSISAAFTTPLDVIKTRIMLAHRDTKLSDLKLLCVLQDIYKEKGFRGLFAGVGPRVIWIALGGFIFFGTYEEVKVIVRKYILHPLIFYKENSEY